MIIFISYDLYSHNSDREHAGRVKTVSPAPSHVNHVRYSENESTGPTRAVYAEYTKGGNTYQRLTPVQNEVSRAGISRTKIKFLKLTSDEAHKIMPE